MTKFAQFFHALFPAIPSQDARERAYLNDCVSLFDLERREREISGGKFAPVREMPNHH